MVSIPHFMVPMQLDSAGHFAVVEQDTEDDVRQCIIALVMTEVGSRLELPDYGVPSVIFTETADAGGIMAAISKWEPRATSIVSGSVDNADEMLRWITVAIASSGSTS